MGLQWVWRGPSVAFGDALLACLAVTVLSIVTLGGPGAAMPLALSWCLPIAAGCVIGAILRKAGTLTMAVQVILLLGLLGVGIYTLMGPVPEALSDDELQQLLEAMGMSQAVTVEEAAAIRPRLAGFFGLQICLELIAALFVVCWLLGIARGRPEFASQYRSLTIGYVLGVPAALICLAALASDYTLLHNLFGIAGLAWLLRGIVYIHGRLNAVGAHIMVYVPVYILGIMFGFSLLIQGIFSDGLFD
jgi:hypothetical protein